MTQFDLTGRLAVVTGAAGGIGRAIVHRLADSGADVVCADRDEAGAKAIAAEVAGKGRRGAGFGVDVADRAQVRELARAAAELGTVQILVTSAGASHRAPAGEMPDEAWDTVMGVNLTGTFACAQAFGPAMAESGWGRIVTISSIAGVVAYKGSAAYITSKGAVIQLTRALAHEWADRGVTVNSVAPGPVESAMFTALREQGDPFFERQIGRMAIEEMIRPDEIAAAVQYLCSPEARMTTGVILPVDGGFLVK